LGKKEHHRGKVLATPKKPKEVLQNPSKMVTTSCMGGSKGLLRKNLRIAEKKKQNNCEMKEIRGL